MLLYGSGSGPFENWLGLPGAPFLYVNDLLR